MGPAALLDYDRKRLRGLVLEEGTANVPRLDRGARARHPRRRRSAETLPASPNPAMPSSSTARPATIYVRPPAEIEIGLCRARAVSAPGGEAQYRALRDKPCVTKDGQPVELMINAGLLAIDLPHIDGDRRRRHRAVPHRTAVHGRDRAAAHLSEQLVALSHGARCGRRPSR